MESPPLRVAHAKSPMNEQPQNQDWSCPSCSNTVPDTFELCWDCGTTRQGTPNPDFTPGDVLDSPNRNTARTRILQTLFYLTIWIAAVLIGVSYLLEFESKLSPSFQRIRIYFELIAGAICLGLAVGLLATLLNHIKESDSQTPEPQPDSKLEHLLITDRVICPNCLTPNFLLNHFCLNCATPLTSHACIDPIGRIYAQGDTYRKAANHPHKFIVVLGMWLLFAPSPIFFIISFWFHLSNIFTIGIFFENQINIYLGIIYQLLSLSIFSLYGAILIKVTRNYYRIRTKIK